MKTAMVNGFYKNINLIDIYKNYLFKSLKYFGNSNDPLHFAKFDIWTWDSSVNVQDVLYFPQAPNVVEFHPLWSYGTSAVIGTVPLSKGKHYWEIKSGQFEGTSIMFGIGTSKAALESITFENLLGKDEHSWGLNHKGYAWHNGKREKFCKNLGQNDQVIIGILYDGTEGTLTYFKNYKRLGVAFRNLDLVTEPLYPMVSSTLAKNIIELCCAKKEFENLQDMCRYAILTILKDPAKIKCLNLPKPLETYLFEDIQEIPTL